MHEIETYETLNNSLEPQSIVNSFLKYPPENFKINNIKTNCFDVYAFLADLDLFLTLDKPLKNFLKKFMRFKFLKNFLTPNVLFVGTTVSEHSLFPQNLNINEFIKELLSTQKRLNKQFVIIKDIPFNSLLLTQKENNQAKELSSKLEKNNFIILEGQALAYKRINFSSFDEYLKNFSQNRKFNFRKKRKAKHNYNLQIFNTGDEFFTDDIVNNLHSLYLNVYNKSEMHFDKLSFEFFKNILQNTNDGKVFVYIQKDKIIGFSLCYIVGNYLVDKYHGYLYPDSLKCFLYFNHFFDNLEFCIQNELKMCIMGWTNADTKAYLGCEFTQTYHAVYVKNPFLRMFLKIAKPLFESDKIN
ncbi:MAG: peptidogalycan biosysnthesis protein [Candidatus Gastranaerophilaceae bacterium]|jgi:hypothetical protein